MATNTYDTEGYLRWQAFSRSSMNWPKHWQVVIYKLDKQNDIMNDSFTYAVFPRNPEYQEYWDKIDMAKNGLDLLEPSDKIPSPHLGPVLFDSMEEIDQWARIAARLSK